MIRVRITRKQLESLGACADGLALFDSIARLSGKKRSITVEWSQLAEVWFSFSKFASWARHNGLAPSISLSQANLSRANLSSANLSRANLSSANLSGANLSGANLSRANLFWADLSGADLSWADLSGADLSWANLYGADLSRADLSWANLSSANLSGANLGRWERGPDGMALRNQ